MANFDFIDQQGTGAGFVYKDEYNCYYFDGTSFTQVTDPDYPSMAAMATISSITRSGYVATVTTATAHGLTSGNRVAISGAAQTQYNGAFTVTVTAPTTFTYVITGTTKTVTSITRVSNTATVTCTAHGYSNGNVVRIAGATQVDYNGAYTISNVTTNTFDYTVANTPTTPATGTITAALMPVTPATGTIVGYSATVATVRGIVYLNGTYYVMTPDGRIRGSDLENITSWSALNVIESRMEPDAGVCLARQLNLIVAFSGYSTEFFYDAANATGSPLSSYASAFLELGCASAGSVAQTENTVFFMGIAKQKGRSIYKMEGTSPVLISNPFIDRILNADDLSDVKSYFLRIAGHGFYVLSLGYSDITLVYDIVTGMWGKWTELTLAATKNITAASWSNNVVTLTVTAHGYLDGACCVVATSNPSGYNGTHVVSVVDANTLTYTLTSNPGTYVGSGTIANYTESYFNMTGYSKAGNFDLVQDSTTGTVYAMDTGIYQDNGIPIRYMIRTSKFDANTNHNKAFVRVEVIGDKVDADAYVRYTDDDYQNWSKFRPVDLSEQRARLYRLGSGRRRAFEVVNYDNVPIRLESLELNVDEGVR